jgi:hypothetical protein
MIELDEKSVCDRLAPLMNDALFEQAMTNLVNDRLFLSVFLMMVSLGESLGEAGVAAIGQDEVASLMHELRRQELEEHGHSVGTRLIAEELFPEFFENGRYLYEASLTGVEYYFAVREANRRRLRERDRYSRLNLYMTTTFGYEVMVELFYGTVIRMLERSRLPRTARERIEFVLTMILRQEETHLDLVKQHNALCGAERTGLSAEAIAVLEQLGRLTREDYEWVADLAVREIVRGQSEYAEPEALRARIMASAASPGS